MLLFQLPTNVSAAESDWAHKDDVDLGKTWTITFNTSIQDTRENKNAVYVTDGEGNLLENEIVIEGKKVNVSAPDNQYAPATTYTLHITEGLTSTSGVPTEKAVTMEFTTENSQFEPGSWTRDLQYNGAILKIQNVTDQSFDFYLNAVSGANAGTIKRSATIQGDEATFSDDQGCTLTFKPSEDKITVNQSNECSMYGGVGVMFSGDYTTKDTSDKTPRFVELGLFSDSENNTFQSLVGEHYDLFTESFQMTSEVNVEDDFGGKAYSGFVRGLANTMTGIVVNGDNGEIYAATLGSVDTSTDSQFGLLYYTTDEDFEGQLPQTILKWKNNLANDQDVYYRSQPDSATYFDDEFAEKIRTGKVKGMPFEIGDSIQEPRDLFDSTANDEVGYKGTSLLFYDNLGFGYGHDLERDNIRVLIKAFENQNYGADDVTNALGEPSSEGYSQLDHVYFLRYDFNGPQHDYKFFIYLDKETRDGSVAEMNLVQKY